MPTIVEICVQSVESAVAAEEGSADRVELCENLSVGGVTPSAGAIAVACRSLRIPVHVLIRPRGGDFCYSEPELAVMRHDIKTAKQLGAHGVVLGLLSRDGTLDRERTARFTELARPLAVTFHKAFDECIDPFVVLDALAELGIERILTSGRAPSALEGIERLAELHRWAEGRLEIMAGGRIDESQIPMFLAAGITEIHIGSSVCVDGTTDARRVRRVVELASRG